MADIELYTDTCGFVHYLVNPVRGSSPASREMGWMRFSITYTFSGMKRPGATLSLNPSDNTKIPSKSEQSESMKEEEDEQVVRLKKELALAT